MSKYPEVGEKVMVEMTVASIKKRARGGVYIDLEYPDWYTEDLKLTVHTTSEQGIVYRIKKED